VHSHLQISYTKILYVNWLIMLLYNDSQSNTSKVWLLSSGDVQVLLKVTLAQQNTGLRLLKIKLSVCNLSLIHSLIYTWLIAKINLLNSLSSLEQSFNTAIWFRALLQTIEITENEYWYSNSLFFATQKLTHRQLSPASHWNHYGFIWFSVLIILGSLVRVQLGPPINSMT